MRYHINPTTGEPGRCSAKSGGCPFGSEDQHYTSPEAAREAFEASNSASTFTMSLKDMNATAKVTDDHNVIAGIIENGSDRTLNNLAKNPNLTDQEVRAALNKTHNAAVRASLLVANKGPHELMTPEDLEEVLLKVPAKDQNSTISFSRNNNDPFSQLVNNPSLTDAHYDKVLHSTRLSDKLKKRMEVVLAEDNSISPQKTRQYLEANDWKTHPVSGNRALLNGKITEQDLIEAPERYLSQFSATRPSQLLGTKEVDVLGRVAVKRGDERLQMWVARDPRTSSAVLNTYGRFDLQAEQIYKNPNTSNHIKAQLAEKHGDEPYVRMDQLKTRVGDAEFDSLMKKGENKSLGRSYGESSRIFDMDKVREYGLKNDDIFYLAGSGGYNAGTSFNPETGVFTGRVDSSG